MAGRSRLINNKLPEELVTDILARLQPKSLVRFKSVQQSWDTLFKSHSFVTKHMMMSSSSKGLMVFEDPGDRTNHDHKLGMKQFTWDDPTLPPRDVPFPLPDILHNLSYVLPFGPCNGVYLLFVFYKDNSGKLILFNPSTREVKVVPNPEHHPDHYDLRVSTVSFGFGIDSITKEYKVIAILLSNSCFCIDVYSNTTTSWTALTDESSLPCSNELSDYSVHANGVCYWTSSNPKVGRVILCYDIGKNQFSEVIVPMFQKIRSCTCHDDEDHVGGAQPEEGHDHGHDEEVLNHNNLIGYIHITQVDDTIGYVAQYGEAPQGGENNANNYTNKIDIWLLNSAEGTWTQVFRREQVDSEIRTFGFWNNGDGSEVAAILNDRELVSFNLQWQPVRQFRMDGVGTIVHILSYVSGIGPLSV